MNKVKKIRQVEKYDLAQTLYLHNKNISQKDLALRVGVAPATIKDWAEFGEWEAKREALTVSPNALVADLLKKLRTMLDAEQLNVVEFTKMTSALPRLQQGPTNYDKINFTLEFNDWVLSQQSNNDNITPEFVKTLTALQDTYLTIIK